MLIKIRSKESLMYKADTPALVFLSGNFLSSSFVKKKKKKKVKTLLFACQWLPGSNLIQDVQFVVETWLLMHVSAEL